MAKHASTCQVLPILLRGRSHFAFWVKVCRIAASCKRTSVLQYVIFLKDVRRLQSVQEYQWFNCYNVCALWSLQQFVLYVNTQKKVCNIDHFFLVEFRQLLLIVSKSSPRMVVKGVPQGSIFVPWLFNLHLKMYFQITVVMFIFYDTTLTTGYKTTKGFCRLEAAIENIQTAFMNIKLVMMSQKTNKQKC